MVVTGMRVVRAALDSADARVQALRTGRAALRLAGGGCRLGSHERCGLARLHRGALHTTARLEATIACRQSG